MEEKHGSIEREIRGDVVVLRLIGDHDVFTVESLREELHTIAGVDSSGGLVVSLTDTTFMDASIVGALYAADERLRERGSRFALHVATAAIVKRVLEVSGLAATLACDASLDAAIEIAAREEGGEWSRA
jgi:anti-anti-sigma factor